MDAFYLRNRALYDKLVGQLDASAPVSHFSRQTAVASAVPTAGAPVREHPNMTVVTRIRPMLEGDNAEGFPCAIYPRAKQPTGSQMIDIHDLYNHPKGRPQLRVCHGSTENPSFADIMMLISVHEIPGRSAFRRESIYIPNLSQSRR